MKSREEIIDYITAGKLNTFWQNLFLSLVLSLLLLLAFVTGYHSTENRGVLIAGLCFSAFIFLIACCGASFKEKLLVSVLQYSLIGLLSSIGFLIVGNVLLSAVELKRVWISVGSIVIWCANITALFVIEKNRFENKTYRKANRFTPVFVSVSAVLTAVSIGLFRASKHFVSENTRLLMIAVLFFVLSYLLLSLCTAFLRVHLILKHHVNAQEVAAELLREKPLVCLANKKRLIISFFAGCAFYVVYCGKYLLMHSSPGTLLIPAWALVYVGIPAISVFISAFKMNYPKNSALSMFMMYAVPIAAFWIIRALWIKNADGSVLSDVLIYPGLNIDAFINLFIAVPALAVCVHFHEKNKK